MRVPLCDKTIHLIRLLGNEKNTSITIQSLPFRSQEIFAEIPTKLPKDDIEGIVFSSALRFYSVLFVLAQLAGI